MSESLHAGYLPLWNPYINYGIPQYGDMSSGFWSPVTWLIASTVGYNAYTFTIEVLAYLLIGGIGMYKLTRCFNVDNKVRFIAAIAYICCGYNVGHLQHFNWLSGAAFLPWCVWGYILLQHRFSVKNVLQSVLLFYLFLSSAHPGLLIGAFYFFIALALYFFFTRKEEESIPTRIKKFIISHVILLIALIILSAGLIIGYTDILPHFTRGDEISLTGSLKNPASVQSWISVLLPLSTTKNDAFFATDISMRNMYFSLTLLLFFISSLFKMNSRQKFFLYTGIAFLLLSAGGIFKMFAYKFIPLISYVRLDGEFVIFPLLCFIIVAAIELNKYIVEKKEFTAGIKWIYYGLEIIMFGCIAYGVFKTVNTREGFFYSLKNINAQSGLALKLKALIDSISFYDTLWLQGIIQLLLLWGIKFCVREKRWNLLLRIVIADVIIATLLNLPFTGVGKASVADVQNVLNRSPKGIPIPALQPLAINDTISWDEKGLVGDWSMYNKQIGTKNEVPYPICLKNIKSYFTQIKTEPISSYITTAFHDSVSPGANTEIISFTGNSIRFKINSANDDIVIYTQAFYPHWQYNNGNGKKPALDLAPFMSAPIKSGMNDIEFSFEPTIVKTGMLISLLFFTATVIILLWSSFIRRSPSPS